MPDRLAAAERAIATHSAFERQDGQFAATATPFDASIRLEPDDGAVRYDVRLELPTLDAVVAGETVADVVSEGWFETFERRLEDLEGALLADPTTPEVELGERDGTVRVTASFASARPDHGAEDAAALVGYVEGTYVEGIIPGYTYREPVSGLLERAYDRSQAAVDD